MYRSMTSERNLLARISGSGDASSSPPSSAISLHTALSSWSHLQRRGPEGVTDEARRAGLNGTSQRRGQHGQSRASECIGAAARRDCAACIEAAGGIQNLRLLVHSDPKIK